MHDIRRRGRFAPPEEFPPPPTPESQRSAAVGSTCVPRCYVGSHTLQSFGKGTNENQDSWISSCNETKCLAAVFDGHGEKGRRISEFAKSAMSKSLFSHKELHSDPKLALENAYRETQSQIEKTHGPDANQSGTTAVACYQHRDRLLVANVGDSRAVLGRCDTARKGSFKAVELTSDQKPSRADEKQRILAMGGMVDQLCFPVRGPNGGVKLMRGGPERVMDSSGFGGLAMSRALGDLSLRPYVSSLPEVSERKLDAKDRFLIVGSDGVWDQMSNQEAVDIASRASDPTHAARELVNQARRRWQTETEGMLSDDITAVVVRLDHDTKDAPERSLREPASRSSLGAPVLPGVPGLARTSQNFNRPHGGDRESISAMLRDRRDGAMTPLNHGGTDRRGDLGPSSFRNLFDRPHDRRPEAQQSRMSQTLGGFGDRGSRREPWAGRPNSNHAGPEGSRRGVSNHTLSLGLGHSRSEPTIGGMKDRMSRTIHGSGGFRPRNDLMRPAGR